MGLLHRHMEKRQSSLRYYAETTCAGRNEGTWRRDSLAVEGLVWTPQAVTMPDTHTPQCQAWAHPLSCLCDQALSQSLCSFWRLPRRECHLTVHRPSTTDGSGAAVPGLETQRCSQMCGLHKKCCAECQPQKQSHPMQWESSTEYRYESVMSSTLINDQILIYINRTWLFFKVSF